MGVNRFDSYGFTTKTCPHQPDKVIVSSLSTKIRLTDVGDWMHLLFRGTNSETVSEREYWVNLDVQSLTWAGAEHSVRNVWMEGAGFAWRELGTSMGKRTYVAAVALYTSHWVSTRPQQAVKREDFAQLPFFPEQQLPRTDTMGDCGVPFTFILQM